MELGGKQRIGHRHDLHFGDWRCRQHFGTLGQLLHLRMVPLHDLQCGLQAAGHAMPPAKLRKLDLANPHFRLAGHADLAAQRLR